MAKLKFSGRTGEAVAYIKKNCRGPFTVKDGSNGGSAIYAQAEYLGYVNNNGSSNCRRKFRRALERALNDENE